MFKPNYFDTPISVDVNVQASDKWYASVGNDIMRYAQDILNQNSGTIHSVINGQVQLSRNVDVWVKTYTSPLFDVQFVKNNSQTYVRLIVRPENVTTSGGSLTIPGQYLVDIPFQGYPINAGPVIPEAGYGFDFPGVGGLGTIGVTFDKPGYFEVEVKLLPQGVPPSTTTPGDFSVFGLTTYNDIVDDSINGQKTLYPKDLSTFCTPFVGVLPGVKMPAVPGVAPKGSTNLSNTFVGSGGQGTPRSVVVFPTKCRYTDVHVQTFQNAVYQVKNPQLWAIPATSFENPQLYYLETIFPKYKYQFYNTSLTVSDQYPPAYNTQKQKDTIKAFTGFVVVNNQAFGLSDTFGATGFYQGKADGSDFPVDQLIAAWPTTNQLPYFPYPEPYNPVYANIITYNNQILTYYYYGPVGGNAPLPIVTEGLNLHYSDDNYFVYSAVPSVTQPFEPLLMDDNISDGLLIGDLFYGPQFKYQNYVKSWSYGKSEDDFYFPLLLTVDDDMTAPSGINSPGNVHSWVIKGSPTQIGNLNSPADDLPVGYTLNDQFGNPQPAAGVWTGVDLGSINVGDTIMVAVRPPTASEPGGVWFGKNGAWAGSQPGQGAGDAVLDPVDDQLGYAPICGAQWGPTKLLMRYGSATKYGVPSGFQPYGDTTIPLA